MATAVVVAECDQVMQPCSRMLVSVIGGPGSRFCLTIFYPSAESRSSPNRSRGLTAYGGPFRFAELASMPNTRNYALTETFSRHN